MITIAIDPGKSGGIAWMADGRARCIPMPELLSGLVSALRDIRLQGKSLGVEVRAWIENVNAMPGEGVLSARTFGLHMGHLEAVCFCLGIGSRKVAPQTWQRALSVPKLAAVGPRPEPTALESNEEFAERKSAWAAARNRSQREKKHAIRELAQARFPGLPVTLRTADALMILDWALKQQPVGV